MHFHLVVVRSFGPYGKGDLISDADTVTAVLASENAVHVVRILAQGG